MTILEKIEEYLDEQKILGQSQPTTWFELGQWIDTLRKSIGMKISEDEIKRIAKSLGITSKQTR